jgi:hypothetical protein
LLDSSRSLSALVAGIQSAAWLNQHQLDFVLCAGFMPCPFGHDEQFAGSDVDCSIGEIDAQLAIDYDKRLIRLWVVMPDKIALQFHDLELIVIHLRNNLRRPLFCKERKLFCQIDGFVIQAASF